MLTATAALLIVSTLGQSSEVFTAEDVEVEARVASQHYSWIITNRTREPIDEFRLAAFYSYNFVAPDGWQWDSTDGVFHAWTEESRSMIRPGRSAEFELRAGSNGPQLGLSTMELGFPGSREPVQLEVWAPRRRSSGQVWATALTLAGIGMLSATLSSLRQRRSASSGR